MQLSSRFQSLEQILSGQFPLTGSFFILEFYLRKCLTQFNPPIPNTLCLPEHLISKYIPNSLNLLGSRKAVQIATVCSVIFLVYVSCKEM